MRATPTILALPLAALAACAPSDRFDDTAPTAVEATCNALDFDYLVGEPIESAALLNTPLRVRILAVDDFVPRDFDPNRLTFTTTTDDTVSRVFCG